MTLTQYRNFVTVAESGGFSAAAQKLFIAQPALTSQIKKMEKEVGYPLFIRNARSITLTEAGKTLYHAAKTILQIEKNATIEIDNIMNGTEALRIGTSLLLSDRLLLKELIRFRKQFPETHLLVHRAHNAELLDRLEEGSLDLAVITSPDRISARYRVHMTCDMPFYAVRNRGSAHLTGLAPMEGISLSSLAEVPLGVQESVQFYLRDMFLNAGIAPSWHVVCDSFYSSVHLLDTDDYVMIMGLSETGLGELQEEHRDLLLNPIVGTGMRNQFSLISTRTQQLSYTTQNFMDIFAETYPNTELWRVNML